MATGFNYSMWNIWWFQFTTFATVFILVAYAAASDSSRERTLFAVAAIVLLTTTVTVLAAGPGMTLWWHETEFREMFIAIGLSIAAFEAAMRLGRPAVRAP